MPPLELAPLEPVQETGRAELLLHPLRQTILSEARTPTTAAEIARRVGLPPQKVNYHVRTLVEAGFLRPAGEALKRNLIEKRYRATAHSYVLLPGVLGDVGPAGVTDADRYSAAHLMYLTARLQQEVGAALGSAGPEGPSIPTLSMDAELRFESAEQRADFARAIQRAIADVIARHAAPARDEEREARGGHPYRLVLGVYPVREHERLGRDHEER